MSELKTQKQQTAKTEELPGRFENKTALITGASDRGIGGAIAERLAREGASIAMLSLDKPARLLKRLERIGKGVEWLQGDVTRVEDVQKAIDRCQAAFKKIDVLANNAGVETAGLIEDLSDEQWRRVLEVNLHGAIAMVRAALPLLVKPGGVIVNVASALALGGCPGYSIYSASKAGLVGLTQSLAWELAPRGVRVVGVAPSLVHTPMTHKHVEHLSEETKKQIEICHPLGVGLPHDVAAAVAFLASGEARWITGVMLPLGWTPGYPLPVEMFVDPPE